MPRRSPPDINSPAGNWAGGQHDHETQGTELCHQNTTLTATMPPLSGILQLQRRLPQRVPDGRWIQSTSQNAAASTSHLCLAAKSNT